MSNDVSKADSERERDEEDDRANEEDDDEEELRRKEAQEEEDDDIHSDDFSLIEGLACFRDSSV